MDEETRKLVKKIVEIVRALELYESYKLKLIKATEKLDTAYQRGEFNYFQYKELRTELLKDRSKKDWLRFYDKYLITLLNQYDYHITRLYSVLTKHKGEVQLAQTIKVKKKNKQKETTSTDIKEPSKDGIKTSKKEVPVEGQKKKRKGRTIFSKARFTKKTEEKPSILPKIFQFNSGKPNKMIDTAKQQPKTKFFGLTDDERQMAERIKKDRNQGIDTNVDNIIPVDEDFIKSKPAEETQDVISTSGKTEIPEKDIELKNPFGLGFLKHIITKLSRKETFGVQKTKVPKELIDMNKIRKVISEIDTTKQVDKGSMHLEAHRFKKIISKKEKGISKNFSSFGALANLLIKQWSLFLIDTFPEFFKNFYMRLKLANIKILSSTYTNVMVLSILIVFLFSGFFFGMIFFLVGLEFPIVIARTLFMSLLLSVTTFFIFFAYPHTLINSRKRQMKINLPFALNHMAAITSSGVSPDTMFRLLSESEEYKGINIEFKKIVDFIDIFGYDLITAIKTVSRNTPSPELKELFDGFISTVETGGDLTEFLKQKGEEQMLSYKLERQKYNETISLYSDIYTGVLIAAPLFFVVALSLVNILGGKLGDVNIDVVISGGTYIVIPLMNVIFMVFLEVSSPGV